VRASICSLLLLLNYQACWAQELSVEDRACITSAVARLPKIAALKIKGSRVVPQPQDQGRPNSEQAQGRHGSEQGQGRHGSEQGQVHHDSDLYHVKVEIDVNVAGHTSTYIFNCVRSGELTVIQPLGMLPPGCPGRWVSGGGGMMCQCPDGSFAKMVGTQIICSSTQQQPRAQPQISPGSASCGGNRYCPAGQKCGSGGGCLPQDAMDCGNGKACVAGAKCSMGGGCVPQNSVDCGNGRSCNPGQKCTSSGGCVSANAVPCGNEYCNAGLICAADNRCISQREANEQDARDDSPCAERDSVACGRIITSGRITGRQLAERYFNRGIILYTKHELDSAISDFNNALSVDHTLSEVLLYRGLAWLNKKELYRALADFNGLIRLEPTNSAAYSNFAFVSAEERDFYGAVRAADQALQYDPNNPWAYSTRGEIKFAKGDVDGAIADLTTSITLKPDLAASYVYRGRAYQEKGQNYRALANYKKALSLSIDGWWYEQQRLDLARRQVAELEAKLWFPNVIYPNWVEPSTSILLIIPIVVVIFAACLVFYFFRMQTASIQATGFQKMPKG